MSKQDEERLLAAAQRVNLYFGCDTPDHMADEILSLRAENKRLREALDSLRALNSRLIAERDEAQAFLRQELDDWAVTDTRIREAAKKVLPLIDVEGDSHCVPSVESIVDALVALADGNKKGTP